ncbi:MAG: hypothetical protein JWP12_2687 [Bacteroidetes bacterium]|nr:hypothetical protein [Bacteroidota bacterium]
MKKIIIAVLISITALQMNAQSAKDIFTTNEIVWYGLDFTQAKFVGQFDQGFGAMPATGLEMKNKWVGQWNGLVAKEPQNFKLKEALRKDNVYYDMAPVNEANSKMKVDACMTFNPGKIDPKDIDAMVKKYAAGDKKQGIGLVFIVENFNKNSEMADVYVTFFDIATKKVLLTEKMSGKAMGVGLRNYWAGAVKAIIKSIDSDQYKTWKSKS